MAQAVNKTARNAGTVHVPDSQSIPRHPASLASSRLGVALRSQESLLRGNGGGGSGPEIQPDPLCYGEMTLS